MTTRRQDTLQTTLSPTRPRHHRGLPEILGTRLLGINKKRCDRKNSFYDERSTITTCDKKKMTTMMG